MSVPHRYDEHDHAHNRRLIEGQNEEIADLHDKLRVALRAMITAGIIFIVASVVVTVQIVSYIDDLETERQDRAASDSPIITANCQTNNEQDQILATLIEVSLRTPAFGAGADPTKLTPGEAQIVASINHIQKLQQAGPQSDFQRVFEDKLAELRDQVDCHDQVDRYLSGEPQSPANQ